MNVDAVACSHSGQELTVLSKHLKFNQNSAFRLKWYNFNVGAVACFHSIQELAVLSKHLKFNQNSAFRLKLYNLNVQ